MPDLSFVKTCLASIGSAANTLSTVRTLINVSGSLEEIFDRWCTIRYLIASTSVSTSTSTIILVLHVLFIGKGSKNIRHRKGYV